ncbi:MAG: hypothetical protein ACW963_04985 [Candidatus Sifarchaeia archaeon]
MVQVQLRGQEIHQRAMQFFSAKNYKVISTTESSITFEDGKDMSTVLLILGILFLLIGAILYYLLSKRHMITVTYSELQDGTTNVNCSTNSSKTLKDSQDFMQTLAR